MSNLAIDGGDRSCPNPLPSWPHYAGDEIEAVADVLRSGKVNQWTGSTVADFEKAGVKAFGHPFAIALFNGSLAIELALITAGIGPGDEVIVTPRSFMASVSCAVMCGATPVFADVDMASQNITPQSIEAVISPRTKAIIPVHLNGWPCDMPGIMALAQRHNIYVIEDCAQAHGAKINGHSVGSFGHAAAFSFCQDKIISTGGEGGMVLFQNKDDWRRAWAYKDHGKNFDTVFNKQHPPGFRWLHESIGTNWRMTGMQAAIGLRQLTKLPDWTARRTKMAEYLMARLSPYEAISFPMPQAAVEHAFYRFCFHVKEQALGEGWDRNRLMAAINAEGVACLEVCSQIYREKAFDNIDFPQPQCPNAVALGKQVLLLVIHPQLAENDLDMICQAVEKVLDAAAR